jgi:hypothetical protein
MSITRINFHPGSERRTRCWIREEDKMLLRGNRLRTPYAVVATDMEVDITLM